MHYQRMLIEKEAPEEVGAIIRYNLSESAIGDRTIADLEISLPPDLVLTYTEHQGSSRIRSRIAYTAKHHGPLTLTPNDILITAGASTSLFIIATALLSRDDHLIVTRPNYATNLETPRAIGCDITFIDLKFEDGFRVDLDRIASAIRLDGSTKLISVCSPSNPMGTMLSPTELRALAQLARVRGCYVVVDETYADLTYDEPITTAACLGDHMIGVSSMSKAYGVPGIRIGWLSTTSKSLQEAFLAAKEQISICGSVLDELVAEQILARREELLRDTKKEMQYRRDCLTAWVQSEEELVEWVRPVAGVMCFIHVKQEPVGGMTAFYDRLLKEHGTYVGPGRWFEQSDTWFRLGYGWPTREELEAGLEAISKTLRG
ncbi:MAG: hypothetical protein M1835_001250 [Candelina submexicana]|nr:MAG: hypothetical protein M1835_001250 [Candelina submexicana]